MIARALATGALAAWLIGCAASQSSPTNLFDAYLRAYAEGDAAELWELSAPEARADGRRLRREMIAMLEDPDVLATVKLQSMFGPEVERVPMMGEREFFEWALLAIRRRLGAHWVRRAVSSWVRISVARQSEISAIVLYREGGGRTAELPLRKIGPLWFVVMSPFPPAEAAPSESE